MSTIKDRTILLVDDEPAILCMCQSILNENGFHNILTADSALSALEKLSCRPDIAVLDVMLPDMDGFLLENDPGAKPHSYSFSDCERRI